MVNDPPLDAAADDSPSVEPSAPGATDVPALLDDRYLRGLEMLDAGDWYDAHEELEELWSGEVGATRHVLQALIQLAIALLHRSRGNLGGALSLFERAIEHVEAVSHATCLIDPQPFAQQLRALLTELRVQRECACPSFDPTLVPRFELLRDRVRAERARHGVRDRLR